MLMQEAQRNLLNGRCWGLRRCTLDAAGEKA